MAIISLIMSRHLTAQCVNFSTYVAKVTVMQKYDATLLIPPPVLNDEAVSPGFPSQLLRGGISGEIHYACVVDKQGRISKYEITKCTNNEFQKAFERAVKTWTYQILDKSFYRERGSPEGKEAVYPLKVKGVAKFGIRDE